MYAIPGKELIIPELFLQVWHTYNRDLKNKRIANP